MTNLRTLKVAELRAAGKAIRENAGASLVDIGDGVLCLEFLTKANTLDDHVGAMLEDAVREVEQGEWKGLVIGNDAPDFCRGANLTTVFSEGAEGLERLVARFQNALTAVRYCAKPVVAAPTGRTSGGGVEISLAASRIVAHAGVNMGLVEAWIGVIPGAGGCKELVRRMVSPIMKQTPGADPLPALGVVMQTIGTARVSANAEEARTLGFLAATDRVVADREQLLLEAKEEALSMAAEGYVAPPRGANCYAAGRDARAALRANVHIQKQGGFLTDFEALIGWHLAGVLCGGDLSAAQWVDEQTFLDLERRAFVELAQHPKSAERIRSLMETGKPLRN